MFNSKETNRILVIPDSIWGPDSGHRSTQYLAKVLKSYGKQVAVYAEDNAKYEQQKENFISEAGITVFDKRIYRFTDQLPIMNRDARTEFYRILDDYEPDAIFYFGTIKNKVSINFLDKYHRTIPYYYLPLTNEFWCFKDFAGRAKGECFKCIHGNPMYAFKYRCLGSKGTLIYLKKLFETIKSRPRILNAKQVYSYSDSQSKTLELFGLNPKRVSKTKIFFDKKTVEGISPNKGDYIVVIGQLSVAKGWHFVPKVIASNKDKEIKFKLVIYNKKNAEKYVRDNQLDKYIDSGKVEILSGLESHSDVLRVVAESFAVFIPSSYPTTGEFSLLESLGLSKPVIAFNVGAHKDFLVNGLNSMVSEVGDISSINENITKLHRDNDLWIKISTNARRTFREVIDFESVSEC